MILLEQVSLQFGDRVLFDDVTLTLTKKYRYIIVGANGTGKSSFLALIAQTLESTLGNITYDQSSQIGWMRQDHHLYDHLTILDVVIKGRKQLWEALEKKNQLLATEQWDEAHSQKLAKLEEKIAQCDGYRAESEAQAILMGLGIPLEMHKKSLKQFSGGWKMRILLAQLLFNRPDILLLDEPTNYLDIASIHWLENYLIHTYPGLLLLVSHDQRFLENVGTCVLDIDYGQIQCYPGNYQQFIHKKEEIAQQKEKEYDVLKERVDRMERFIERFRSKPSKAKQCSSREKMIERIKWPEIGRSSRQKPQFVFSQEMNTGQIVLKATRLCKLFEPDIFIGPLDLEVQRGERIALIGENGAGKTTLLKLFTNQMQADEGEVKIGQKVKMAIFHQEHKHLFSGDETIFEWLENQVIGIPEEKRRQVIGQMLFRPQDINKKISMLSGGEMARLLLAKIMLLKANLLVLDEPTNHLDLESKQALVEALLKFPGTVIFVSHDRYFIEQTATRIVEIKRESFK